jgi:hypothetical protein
MRKALIAFVLQSREHFLHQMPTLREEFICAISGRLININIKSRPSARGRFLVKPKFARVTTIRTPRNTG